MTREQCLAIQATILIAGDRIEKQVNMADPEWAGRKWPSLTSKEAIEQADMILIEAQRHG